MCKSVFAPVYSEVLGAESEALGANIEFAWFYHKAATLQNVETQKKKNKLLHRCEFAASQNHVRHSLHSFSCCCEMSCNSTGYVAWANDAVASWWQDVVWAQNERQRHIGSDIPPNTSLLGVQEDRLPASREKAVGWTGSTTGRVRKGLEMDSSSASVEELKGSGQEWRQ